MIFTFQFVRFRRGVPEVIGERRCDAPDQTAALARAKRLLAHQTGLQEPRRSAFSRRWAEIIRLADRR